MSSDTELSASDKLLLEREQEAWAKKEKATSDYREARMAVATAEEKRRETKDAAGKAHEEWSRIYQVTKELRPREQEHSPARLTEPQPAEK